MATGKAPWQPPREVRDALAREGLSVPDGRRVTELGYTTRELKAIEKQRRQSTQEVGPCQ